MAEILSADNNEVSNPIPQFPQSNQKREKSTMSNLLCISIGTVATIPFGFFAGAAVAIGMLLLRSNNEDSQLKT